MNQFGKLFLRPTLALVLVVMVVAAVMPQSAAAMLALQTTDFNTCAPFTGWTLENPKGIAGVSAATVGAFTGDSFLKLTLPAGIYASMSNGNVVAPRLMTPITDTSFEIEAKFLAPQISTSAGYKIEGLLFRDNTEANNVKWLRVDFNSTNNKINSYITFLRADATGYIDGSQINLSGVTTLPGGPTTTQPILLRVKYEQPTGAWTVTYTMNGVATPITFNESRLAGIAFAPNSMGVFIANSETGALGHESRLDYIHVIGTTLNDDAVTLTVNKTGNGSVLQTNCVGNVVALTATAAAGSTFTSWTGADNSTANPTTVTMTTSKTVTANFSGGTANLDERMYLPLIGN